jgi:hypothetical protein
MNLVPRPGGESTRAGPQYEDSAILEYLVELLRGQADSFTIRERFFASFPRGGRRSGRFVRVRDAKNAPGP